MLVASHLLVMDKTILHKVQMRNAKKQMGKIRLLGEYSDFFHKKEILYPASQEERGVILMFDYIEDACLGLWKSLT